jgi:ABC-type dipeptide/oligopeptide/nickel transport system permease subunit
MLLMVRSWRGRIGIAIIATFALLALLAPWIDRYAPAEQHLQDAYSAPSATYWLGTDQLGRDQYSRLVHGARVSLTVGVITQVVAVGLGVSVGLAAGLSGRSVDSLLMRVTDVAYSFPDLLLVILLVSIFGTSGPMLVLAIGLVSWTTIARLVRAQVLSLREEPFVVAARALGASEWSVAWRHLLPNVMGPVIVTATFGVPAAIFAEAALSLIGLGLPPPAATWGRLVDDSRSALFVAPHLAVSSCGAIALTMLGFSFLGDTLHEALDPRVARRQLRGQFEQAEIRPGQRPERVLPKAA